MKTLYGSILSSNNAGVSKEHALVIKALNLIHDIFVKDYGAKKFDLVVEDADRFIISFKYDNFNYDEFIKNHEKQISNILKPYFKFDQHVYFSYPEWVIHQKEFLYIQRGSSPYPLDEVHLCWCLTYNSTIDDRAVRNHIKKLFL